MTAHEQRVDFATQFAGANEVVVTDNLGRRLGSTADATQISSLFATLAQLGDGWHVPEDGTPVARLRLNFLRDDVPLGNLGVASTFLVAHVHGGFVARNSDVATSAALRSAIGLDQLIGTGGRHTSRIRRRPITGSGPRTGGPVDGEFPKPRPE